MGAPAIDFGIPDPQQAGVAPAAPAAAPQLSPGDAAALANVPGIDPQKLAAMQQAVNARQPAPQAPQPEPQQPIGPQPVANPLGIAGYLPGTTSSTVSGLSKADRVKAEAAQRDLVKAQEAELAAAQRQSAVAQEKAQLTAQNAKVEAEAAHQAVTEAQTDAAERSRATHAAYQGYQQAAQDFRATKIDPDRWWNNRSTGQKIAATLATAFDAMGAAWSRSGRTPTIDAIQHAIERDIDGQKMAYEAKARGVNMAATAYQMVRESGADDASAKAVLRFMGLVEAEKMWQARLAGQTLVPEQQAASAAFEAQLKERQAQTVMHGVELAAQHVSSTSSKTPLTNVQLAAMQNGTAGGGGPGAMPKPQAITYARDLVAMAKREGISIDGNMLADALATGRLPVKALEQFQAAMRVKGIQRRLETAINNYHDAPIGSAEAGRYQAEATALIGDIQGQAGIAKGQALTAEESKAFNDLNKPPSREMPSVSMAGIQTAREKEIARARGVIAGLVAPVEGNLAPFGYRGGLSNESGAGGKVKFQRAINGRNYLVMEDGTIRDGGAAR